MELKRRGYYFRECSLSLRMIMMHGVKEFKSLRPNIKSNSPELKVGTLKDGRTVLVRKKVVMGVQRLKFKMVRIIP